VAGPIADRYGYRPTLLIGIAAVVVSAVGTAVAPNYGILLLAGLVGAISRAVLAPVALTIAATWFDADLRRRAIGMVTASVAGAAVVGVPLLTGVAVFGGWRGAFLTLALGATAIVVLARWALPPNSPSADHSLGARHFLAAYLPLLRDRATMGMIGSTLLRSAGAWAVGSYVVSFLVLEHGLTLQEASLSFAAGGAGIMAGSLVAGGRLGAAPPRAVVMCSSALGGSGLGAALVLPVPPLAIMGLTFAGFLLNGVGNVASSTLLADETRGGQATTMGLNGAALSLSSALGGSAGGLALAFGGYQAVGWVAPIYGLAAASLIWPSRPGARGARG
jgi:DHA1 family inner membrane transport protein